MEASRKLRYRATHQILFSMILMACCSLTPRGWADPCPNPNNPKNGANAPPKGQKPGPTEQGGNGKKGDNGTNGATGGSGGCGGTATAEADGTAKATGGSGAVGGNGGNGRKGQDGGKGGVGGNGGDAMASAKGAGKQQATASGGNGETGGDGGQSGLGAKTGNGGNGGAGGDSKAEATSTLGGAVATAGGGQGGKGGGPWFNGAVYIEGNGGNGATGGTARAYATGQTYALAKATGGKGGSGGPGGEGVLPGDTGGNGGDGKDGGAAIAEAKGGYLALANAVGGNGGTGGAGGKGGRKGRNGKTGDSGNGGSATAEATAKGSGNLPSLASAYARGGTGGGNGKDGTATATADATSKTLALAVARAVGGNPISPRGDATSSATATSNRLAIALASSKGGRTGRQTTSISAAFNGKATVPKLVAQADGPLQNAVATESWAGMGGPLAKRSLFAPLQGGAFATALPSSAEVASVSAGDPNVISGLALGAPGTQVLGWTALGAAYPMVGEGGRATYNTSVDFTLNLAHLNGELKVGLLNPLASETSFDSLGFQVLENGSPVFSDSFASLDSAKGFFHDDVLDLGPIRSHGSSPLDLKFDLRMTASAPAAAFNTDFLIADVGNTMTPTPEPATLFLLGSGVLGFAGLLRKRLRA